MDKAEPSYGMAATTLTLELFRPDLFITPDAEMGNCFSAIDDTMPVSHARGQQPVHATQPSGTAPPSTNGRLGPAYGDGNASLNQYRPAAGWNDPPADLFNKKK